MSWPTSAAGPDWEGQGLDEGLVNHVWLYANGNCPAEFEKLPKSARRCEHALRSTSSSTTISLATVVQPVRLSVVPCPL